MPDFLEKMLLNYYSKNVMDQIEGGFKVDRPLTLRVNNIKTTIECIVEYFNNYEITYKRVSWYDNAFIILNKSKEEIEQLDIYDKGFVYFQSLSSMLPPLFMDVNVGEQILDMAAAPGGKTTELAALSNNGVMITAIEKNKIRAERLKYNIEKQGAKKVSVLQMDARMLDEYFIFDKILLDAPCSGSGTLNINDDMVFSEELVNRSIDTQIKLLSEAIKHLKKGGEIIYSTCSILKEENENVLNEILKRHSDLEIVPLDISKYSDLPLLPVSIPGTLCVMPNEYYEGFFVSKLRKSK